GLTLPFTFRRTAEKNSAIISHPTECNRGCTAPTIRPLIGSRSTGKYFPKSFRRSSMSGKINREAGNRIARQLCSLFSYLGPSSWVSRVEFEAGRVRRREDLEAR